VNNVSETTPSKSALTVRVHRRNFQRGQTLVEYALILAIISIVAIGVMINLGQQTKGLYTMIDSAVSSAQSPSFH
jgi:Flp pilus assembly pilin Flp